MASGPPPFGDTFGPFLIGALVSLYCTGLIGGQASTYFTRNPWGRDRKVFFFAVLALVVLDLAGSFCAAFSAYYFSISKWGDQAALSRAPLSLGLNPPIAGLCAIIVQTFYAYRVWVVGGKRKLFPILITILAVVQLAFSLGGPWLVLRHTFREYAQAYNWGIQLWLCTAAAADVLITGCIIYFLRKVNKESGFAETSTLVRKIMRSTMENNLATAGLALGDALSFNFSHTNWHLVLAFALPKFYILSLLVSLNARESVGTSTLNGSGRRSSTLPGGSFPSKSQHTSVTITRTTVQVTESTAEDDYVPSGPVARGTLTRENSGYEKSEESALELGDIGMRV